MASETVPRGNPANLAELVAMLEQRARDAQVVKNYLAFLPGSIGYGAACGMFDAYTDAARMARALAKEDTGNG